MMTVTKATGMRLPEAVVHPGLKVTFALPLPLARAAQGKSPSQAKGKKSSKGKESSGRPRPKAAMHRRGKTALGFLHRVL